MLQICWNTEVFKLSVLQNVLLNMTWNKKCIHISVLFPLNYSDSLGITVQELELLHVTIHALFIQHGTAYQIMPALLFFRIIAFVLFLSFVKKEKTDYAGFWHTQLLRE